MTHLISHMTAHQIIAIFLLAPKSKFIMMHHFIYDKVNLIFLKAIFYLFNILYLQKCFASSKINYPNYNKSALIHNILLYTSPSVYTNFFFFFFPWVCVQNSPSPNVRVPHISTTHVRDYAYICLKSGDLSIYLFLIIIKIWFAINKKKNMLRFIF